MTKRILGLISAIALVLVVVPSVRGDGAYGAAAQATATGTQQTGQGMQMGMSMQDMMKMHEKMMADMKAEQAKLDELVKKMNSATGDAKLGVMAELLTEIVRDHRTMGERMDTMHQHMMKMGK